MVFASFPKNKTVDDNPYYSGGMLTVMVKKKTSLSLKNETLSILTEPVLRENV